MKTKLHAYYLNINNPDEKKAYDALCKRLTAQGLTCFETWGGGSHYLQELDGQTITLETEFLFNNQWNTAPIGLTAKGYRVFDWAQDYIVQGSKAIKKGHYLEQTQEMKDTRDNTLKCGYCGKHYPKKNALIFCHACIDSEYLTEKNLRLLRLTPISQNVRKYPELNDEEKAFLLPIYREGQLHGVTARGKARRAKEKEDLEKKYLSVTRNAKIEHDGLLWLWERGFKLDNVIYYNHTNKFCFGWRTPIDADLKSRLLDILSEFPFEYEFKEDK